MDKFRKIVRKVINEDDFEIPQDWQEFDDYEFHGAAKDAAVKDIGDEFEDIGKNKFEKGMSQKNFAQNVTKANLKLDDYEKEAKNIQKGIDFKKQGEKKLKGVSDKMGGPTISMNEEDENEIEYDFDQTNLYKFLKDAIYKLEEKGVDYAEMASIIEKELNKYFDIKKK